MLRTMLTTLIPATGLLGPRRRRTGVGVAPAAHVETLEQRSLLSATATGFWSTAGANVDGSFRHDIIVTLQNESSQNATINASAANQASLQLQIIGVAGFSFHGALTVNIKVNGTTAVSLNETNFAAGDTIAGRPSVITTQNVPLPPNATGHISVEVIHSGFTLVPIPDFAITNDGTGPQVASFGAISSPRSTPVSSALVTFTQAINPATFDVADITLKRNNVAVPLSVTLSHYSGNTYRIAGLGAETTPNGNYALTVSASGIQDLPGNPGTGNRTVNWVMSASNAPTLTLTAAPLAYTVDGSKKSVDTGATVSDPDNVNFNNGVLTVSLVQNAASGDRLEIRNQGTGSGLIGVSGSTVSFQGTSMGTFSGGAGTNPLVVTLNSGATVPAVQALMRDITFRITGATPSLLDRTVRFQLTDGTGGMSNLPQRVISVNGPPVVTLPSGPLNYVANGSRKAIDLAATVSDPDSNDFNGGRVLVRITQNASSADRLQIRNHGTGAGQISISGNVVSYEGVAIGLFLEGAGTSPLVVDFNAATSTQAIQALVRSITFRTSGDTPSTLPRTVQFQVFDGERAPSAVATKTINVTT